MKCKNCGTELPEGAVFCGSCGSRQEQQEANGQENGLKAPKLDTLEQEVSQSSAEKKAVKRKPETKNGEDAGQKKAAARKKTPHKKTAKISKKMFFAAVIAVAVIIAVAVFAVSRGSKVSRHDVNAVLDLENDCINVIYDTKVFTIPLEDIKDDVQYFVRGFSNNRAIYAGVVGIGNQILGEHDSITLYALDSRGSYQKIYDGERYDVEVAADSTAAAIIDGENALILYDGKKNTKVADDVKGVRISPDGKTLVYTTIAEPGEDSDVMLYMDGESTKIEKNMTVYSVSNKGKYIYAVDNENSRLYVLNAKGESEKVQSDASILDVSPDGTQILFHSGSNVYVSVKGGEKQKLFSSDSLNVDMVNTYTNSLTASGYGSHFYFDNHGNVLYYVDKSFETTKIASSVTKAYVTEDEKTVFYVKGGAVYEYKLSAGEDEKRVKDYSSSAGLFAVAQDGKSIYYVNTDEELCCFAGDEATVIEDEGEDVYALYLHKDGTLFYLFDRTYNAIDDYYVADLYCYQKGKAKSLASDVSSVSMGVNTLCYTTYDGDEYEYFVSGSGIKFKSVFQILDRHEVEADVSDDLDVSLSVETDKRTLTTSGGHLTDDDDNVYCVTIMNNSERDFYGGYALKIYVGNDYDIDNFITINKRTTIGSTQPDYDFNVSLEGEFLIITPGNYSFSKGRLVENTAAEGNFDDNIPAGQQRLTLIMDGISENNEITILS